MSKLYVRVAELRAATAGTTLVTVGLGSCVAIVLHDPVARVGALAHVLLPSPSLARSATHRPARVPQTAVPAMMDAMSELGADRRRLQARLAGGAAMFANLASPGTIQMGERNLVATRTVLLHHDIPIMAEAVGGDYGRTVTYTIADGRVVVSSVAHGSREL
jgi:chemotaxis protein CheD